MTEEFLLLILIGVVANANDVDLANNTTILLLLALILFDGFSFNGNNNDRFCRRDRIFF